MSIKFCWLPRFSLGVNLQARLLAVANERLAKKSRLSHWPSDLAGGDLSGRLANEGDANARD